ncbi:MAG: hypothetical protein HRT74_06380 [Flavobacteriales bacterium]|nr:hypothetical protein [Flavobacteriales bacterium]
MKNIFLVLVSLVVICVSCKKNYEEPFEDQSDSCSFKPVDGFIQPYSFIPQGLEIIQMSFDLNNPDILYFVNPDLAGGDILYQLNLASGQASVMRHTDIAGIFGMNFHMDGYLLFWDQNTNLWKYDIENDALQMFDTGSNYTRIITNPDTSWFLAQVAFSSELHKLDLEGNILDTITTLVGGREVQINSEVIYSSDIHGLHRWNITTDTLQTLLSFEQSSSQGLATIEGGLVYFTKEDGYYSYDPVSQSSEKILDHCLMDRYSWHTMSPEGDKIICVRVIRSQPYEQQHLVAYSTILHCHDLVTGEIEEIEFEY